MIPGASVPYIISNRIKKLSPGSCSRPLLPGGKARLAARISQCSGYSVGSVLGRKTVVVMGELVGGLISRVSCETVKPVGAGMRGLFSADS